MFDNVALLAVNFESIGFERLKLSLKDLGCTIFKIDSYQQTFDILTKKALIDIIVFDLDSSNSDGFECITQLKQHQDWREIPVFVTTSTTCEAKKLLILGANDFVAKPYNPEELKLRVVNLVRSKRLADLTTDVNKSLESEVAKRTTALRKSLELARRSEYEISLRLGLASEFRDQQTGSHIRRISELSNHLARLAGINEDQCEILQFASPLHDVGKIGIPDHILLKPGKLDPSEFDIIKRHPEIGGKILSNSASYPIIDAGRIIATQHHEKWDGSGYPNGIKGENIHIFARIVAIVDVYDALVSKRHYKEPYSLEKTTSIMLNGKAIHFDPYLLDLFYKNMGQFIEIENRLIDDEPHDLATIAYLDSARSSKNPSKSIFCL